MDLVRLFIKGISFSQTQKSAYALVLGEEGTQRKLPIVIGTFEAQSIAIAIESKKKKLNNRPFTHDLFKSFAVSFDIFVRKVIIKKIEKSVFYSYIVCEDKQQKVIKLDSRTSDAIALAIRFDAPIYTYEEVMKKGSINIEVKKVENKNLANVQQAEKKEQKLGIYELTMTELEEYLVLAVEEEDYEQAAFVRDEIERRKKGG